MGALLLLDMGRHHQAMATRRQPMAIRRLGGTGTRHMVTSTMGATELQMSAWLLQYFCWCVVNPLLRLLEM